MAGSIEPYKTAAGARYRVRYRKPDGSPTDRRGFTTKRDARLFLASVEVSKATGEYIDPAMSRVTVGHLGPTWLASKKTLKASSYHSLETSWRVHVEPKWGSTPLDKIQPSSVEEWVQQMTAGTAPTRRGPKSRNGPRSATVVIRAVGVLAGILDNAVRDRRLPRNPARGITNMPKKVSIKERRYLTHDEVFRFADAHDDPSLATLAVFLAYTGLRWGEATGLRVKDLDMLRRRVHVRRNAVGVNGTIIEGAPKSWEKRSAPFPAFLAMPLATLCESKGANDLIFGDEHGGYFHRPKTSQGETSWWITAVKRSKIRRFTPHDLRHTAASLAIASGANVKAVQRMLGHKSAALTLDVYADLFEDDLEDVAMRLDENAMTSDVGKAWAERAA